MPVRMAPATASTLEPVDHDLEHGVHALGQRARGQRPDRRAKRVVGRRDHPRISARADLAAAADDAAWKRQNHAGHAVDRGDGGFGGGQRRGRGLGQDQEIAAGHALLLEAEALLQQALAFHHGNAPVPLAVHHLARLQPVTERAQRAAGRQAVGCVRQSVEAAGGGTREDGLADTLGQALAESLGVHGEQQHGDAGTRVRCLVGPQFALDGRFDLAGDHGRRKAGELGGGRPGPGVRGTGHDHARGPHAEGLGERVLDVDAANVHDGLPR